MSNKFEIRNGTAEFLIFQIEGKESGVQVKNIYETGELTQEATTEDFSVVQTEGERQVNRNLKFYNLDVIISVGCLNHN